MSADSIFIDSADVDLPPDATWRRQNCEATNSA